MANELIVVGFLAALIAGYFVFDRQQKRKKFRDYVNKYIIGEGPGFYYNDISLEVPESVYYPREDSLLVARHIEKLDFKNKRCLDMGCGCGFFAVLMAKKGALVTASDINPEAVEITKQNAKANDVKLTAVQSDVFSKISSRYDFISFNPPYLPTEDAHKYKDQWSGGKTGRDVIEKFLQQAQNHLNKDGSMLMIFSSLTGEKEVRGLAEKCGFAFRVLERQKIPWEELIVVELSFA